jgi:hypothetical protein
MAPSLSGRLPTAAASSTTRKLHCNAPRCAGGDGVPSGPYMHNVEIIGSTSYEGSSGDSIEECRRLCASQTKCVAVEHNRPAGRCQFYDQRAMTRQNQEYDAWLRK